jgi:hypothetical protein
MPPPSDRLEKLLDTLQSLSLQLEHIRVSLEAVVELTKDHESRLRHVEVAQHRLTPFVSGLVVLLTTLATVAITQWLTHA